jgi:hypothetical protein
MRIQSTVSAATIAATVLVTRGSPAVPVTFSRDVQPILNAHCTNCHTPGGPAPMSLVTYADATRWAAQIKDQTLRRRMPVWHAARGYGAFANDPTLSPFELAALASWVDGGTPPGQAHLPNAEPARPPNRGAIPAGTLTALVRVRGGWATGWDFVPGDPLISSARFTSGDESVIGTWTAGDPAVRLPSGSAVRVASPVTIEIWRRRPTEYETPFTARPSSLRFTWLAATKERPHPVPARRVWTEHLACGATLGPTEATVIGVRPVLAAGAAAQITIERIGGAQPELLGWFRAFDPVYPRMYWLERPIDSAANARLTSDAPCQLDVVLTGRRSQTGSPRAGRFVAPEATPCSDPCAGRAVRTRDADRATHPVVAGTDLR